MALHPLARMTFVIAAAFSLVACPNAQVTPEPPPPPGSWLVMLCKASDDPAEPFTPDYVRSLFAASPRGYIYDYFIEISGGRHDVSASRILGWTTASVTKAQLDPAVRNAGSNPGRVQTLRDCKTASLAAAAAAGVAIDPKSYAALLVIFNIAVDAGAAPENPKPWGSVIAPQQLQNEATFVQHEMIHALGILEHSRRTGKATGPDHVFNGPGEVDYQDCWDIMSSLTCVYTHQSAANGASGPELNAVYLDRLGWLDQARVARVSPAQRPQSFTLSPIGDPSKPGLRLLLIDGARNGTYTVEYREAVRFDRGAPKPAAVVIREVKTAKRVTAITYRANDEIDWVAGETFVDSGNLVALSVDAIGGGSATVTLRSDLGTPLQPGALCGNRETGPVLQCPALTECQARRLSPQLMSADWFCD